MKSMFVITITINENHPKEGRSFFSDKGECIGSVLDIRKNSIDPNNVFCSYDVETTKEIYEQLENGTMKLYGLDDYTVSRSSTNYVAN